LPYLLTPPRHRQRSKKEGGREKKGTTREKRKRESKRRGTHILRSRPFYGPFAVGKGGGKEIQERKGEGERRRDGCLPGLLLEEAGGKKGRKGNTYSSFFLSPPLQGCGGNKKDEGRGERREKERGSFLSTVSTTYNVRRGWGLEGGRKRKGEEGGTSSFSSLRRKRGREGRKKKKKENRGSSP